jgi:uncharacterized protein (DUF1697 family)
MREAIAVCDMIEAVSLILCAEQQETPSLKGKVSQELYIYYTNGIGRSKLTGALIEKTLKTAGTARNWNTILQLQKMMQRQDPASYGAQ